MTAHVKIRDAELMLARLRQGYAQSLRAVDRLLRSAVAQDPAQLEAARAVQAEYGRLDMRPAALAPLEQPTAAHDDPPMPTAEAPTEPPAIGTEG